MSENNQLLKRVGKLLAGRIKVYIKIIHVLAFLFRYLTTVLLLPSPSTLLQRALLGSLSDVG
jgi:hypothetical protein